MLAFFHVWRRKMGVVTLVTACVFAGWWIRGIAIEDSFLFGNGSGGVLEFISTSHDGLLWWRQEIHPDSYPMNWHAGWSSQSLKAPHFKLSTLADGGDDVLDRQWQLCGLEFGRRQAVGQGFYAAEYWRVKYPTIVLPLALLSAFLLLSKSRPKPNQTDDKASCTSPR